MRSRDGQNRAVPVHFVKFNERVGRVIEKVCNGNKFVETRQVRAV